MRIEQLGRLLVACEFLAFCSCTFNEPRIRSEPILFFPGASASTSEPPKLTLAGVPMHCVQSAGIVHRWIWSPLFSSGSSKLDECVYETVNVEELRGTLERDHSDPVKQNSTLSLMLAVENQNCNNFRAKFLPFAQTQELSVQLRVLC
jgi:hypothetical protein